MIELVRGWGSPGPCLQVVPVRGDLTRTLYLTGVVHMSKRHTESDKWKDPYGKEWKLPPNSTKLSPWKRTKHKAIADFVYSRAVNKCEKCGSTSCLCIDHIIPRRVSGGHHPDNLQALCDSCHGRKTGRECSQWPLLQFPPLKHRRCFNGIR